MGAGVAWIVGAWWGIFLLCRRGQGEDQVPGLDRSIPVRCGPGQFLHQDNVLRCCSRCSSSTWPCSSDQPRNCTCATPGELCGDPDCKSCKKHPCSPGQQVLILGKFVFGFTCKDCEVGTYSDGIDGKCLPWTDCGREGFLTVRPGNRTHNVLCGMALLPGPGSGPGLSNSYSIPVAILTALATITFMLVIIQLVLYIWWVKKEPSAKDRESILHMGPDDIGNCPFPEEEWGEKTAEDKVQMGHPWV